MPARRKPFSNSNIHHDGGVPYPGAPSTPSRYISADSSSPESSFENIKLDHSVSVPQQRLSRFSPVRTPSLSTVPEASDENSLTDKSSLSRKSSSSSATITHQGHPDPNSKDLLPRPHWSSEYNTLPTINSGEPLHWDSMHPHGEEDPFGDSQASPRLSSAQLQSTVRPVPSGYDYPGSSWQLPSRPTSAYSAVSSVPSLHPTSSGHASQHSQVLPTYAGSVDHFQHDTEAYASGTFSRPSYRPPRSRSPTPAVDDEDYHIVGNTSVHYTGFSPQRQSQSYEPGQDDEEYDDYDDDEYDEYDEDEAVDDEKYAWQEEGGQDIAYRAPFVHANGTYTYADAKYNSASDGSSLTAPPHEPETPVETRHFGPAPVGRVLRRHKTKKRVQLTNGNLVVNLNVPPKLALPRRGDPEMMKTRYTAVTCDPDDFERNGFILRQNESRRTTELFIVITMYNEDEVLFCRTIHGVMRNISHLCTRKNSRTWGQEAWKKVVVCIVADGRKKVHPRVLDCLTLLGVYQPGDHMKKMVNNKPVTAHLFEYTTSFALDEDLRFRYPDKGIVPTQILFCMKAKNQKKINSHRWFFNAFAPLLQPNVCVLLDVGTRPGNKSIYHLWKTFDLNSNVAGACGEIAAYKGKNWRALLNPLVAGQNFEYKIANILDKPMESMFGYISVLPGAFSAYRYVALQNNKQGQGPLASYFKGEVLHGADTDIFTSNMYLAEDRILCFELVAKVNSSWILKYVKSAIAETDVPDALPEFISQRRRWLNGSFFAATYAIAHVGQILRSGHSVGRKFMLVNETIYNSMNLVAAWFAIGNFYVFFVILTSSLEDPAFHMTWIKYINSVIQFFMASLVVSCFLVSMGNKPQSSKWKYKLSAISFAVLMAYQIFAAVMCSVKAAASGGTTENVMLFSVCITYGIYAFSSLLAFDPWHMFTSFVPYLLLSPTYINILNIYAFANLDDISWGTKQDTDIETDLGAVIQNSNSQVDVEMLTDVADVNGIYEDALDNLKHRKPVIKADIARTPAEKDQAARDYYANVRTNVLLTWVFSNAVLLVAILGGSNASTTFTADGFTRTKAYMTFILVFVAMTSIVRFLGSTMYLVARIFTG